ncbi:tRNA-modifying protein YgfZ [Buchnera aphidicola (Aphis craccivora)]|uniref:tRNA-modifying protein YgfZ n=1 Tax=Buchnera aphidicola (Aphis craccivora) TaxID=466616 RepID=A0A4D6XNH0_9GAMM|nr:tRNA-modifying protein YgfZ [Buchnera aphidicola]QCI16667.1 tRNA-modifying protein YgfZ [Buchnera aphidicola (Aphis craccivora)]QLL40799.1 tRNA-modifying protein YgfZ [Buchnera aphidicola (Aphis craccivore)]WAI17639.1 MAG: tRNA-modifying protein YgfZ [Buchnera aphidicola (Aphis craccivora)]
MSLFNFSENAIYSSIQLPLALISLEKWSVIYIDGSDSKKFLQNQLTIDINDLEKTQHKICAYCNLNGKVYSTMLLFHYRKGYACIIKKSLFDLQIKEFKKYIIFLKVKIHQLDDVFLLGLSGKDARLFLSKQFINIPNNSTPVVSHKKTTILWFSNPCERFLLVLSLQDFLLLKQKINEKIVLNNSKQWILLDIEAGYPIIGKTMSQKFLPQSINLDKLQAISLNKGCYYGQEIIAQVFYKNLNKHSLYLLSSKGSINPKIGSIIKVKILKKWFRIGYLLAIVHLYSNEIWIQAVLNKSVNIKNIFRISGFKTIFLIKN